MALELAVRRLVKVLEKNVFSENDYFPKMALRMALGGLFQKC